LKVLAWEMKARVAVREPEVARSYLDNALAALGIGQIPGAAWRVHACASRLYALAGSSALGEQHRKQAVALLQQLAQSFPIGDAPEGAMLRASLLAASRNHPLLRWQENI
jgi:hypothetical protein